MTKFEGYLNLVFFLLECLCAIIGLLNYKKLKNSYWKWFVFYVVAIALLEGFSRYVMVNYPDYRIFYYDLFVIPFEFLFLYWLYGYNSLDNKKRFWICSCLYLLSFIPHFLSFEVSSPIYSFNYIVGTLLLFYMVLSEFNKQIKTDEILYFKTNMMFYVNAGVIVFYMGTLPFFTFYGLLLKDIALFRDYYIFSMVCNMLMYSLFIAAFIWGKPNLPSSS